MTLSALIARVEEGTDYRALARKLSDALIQVRPLGGSELFMRVGEEFFADPVYCGAEIERLRQENHEFKLRAITAERALRAIQSKEGPSHDA